MSFVLSIPLLSKAWGALHHSLHLTNEAKQGEAFFIIIISFSQQMSQASNDTFLE